MIASSARWSGQVTAALACGGDRRCPPESITREVLALMSVSESPLSCVVSVAPLHEVHDAPGQVVTVAFVNVHSVAGECVEGESEDDGDDCLGRE